MGASSAYVAAMAPWGQSRTKDPTMQTRLTATSASAV